MMPMGKGPMPMMDEAPEPDLDSDAKVEAIRSALRELVQIVGGISVEEAKAKKAAPAVQVEVEPEEE
jgi:hypothetical protein